MRRIKKGATLLVTTVALSVVTITSAAFVGVFLRYEKMNNDLNDIDREKIILRNNINIAFEQFLIDSLVEVDGVSKKLRTEWLSDIVYQDSLPVSFSEHGFVADFENRTTNHQIYGLTVSGKNYTINSELVLSDSDRWSLNFINYERSAE